MNEQDELLAMLQSSVTRFLEDNRSQTHDDDRLWAAMAELGWLALLLPETLGGSGLGVTALCTLTNQFGRYALNSRYIGQSVMPSLLLAAVGSGHARLEAMSQSLASGESVVALAWQESAGQQRAGGDETQLAQGVLSGRKCFVAGADRADYFLVTARQDGEVIVAWVAARAEGVRVDCRFDSSGGFGDLTFQGVAVSDDAIILRGDAAAAAVEHSLQVSRLALAAELEGLASGCLAKLLAHLTTRRQFGRPLGAFQALRHRCVDLLMETRLAESSWKRATRIYSPDQPRSSYQISAAKARCGDAAFKVAREAVQMHGAMGFMEETGIGSYLRNAITGASWLGGAGHHRHQLLAAIGEGVLSV